MRKGRLEAFNDGVIAVIITIMVLEIKAQHVADDVFAVGLANATGNCTFFIEMPDALPNLHERLGEESSGLRRRQSEAEGSALPRLAYRGYARPMEYEDTVGD